MTTTPAPADPSVPDAERDAALLARVVRQDCTAFDELYDRHVVTARGIARRIAGPHLADDVCQEAFVAVWRAAASYDPSLGNVRTWLLSIVRNRSVDALRRRARAGEHETGDEALAEHHAIPSAEVTEAVALRRIEADRTRRLLRVLTEEQAQVIELAFFGELTHHEIAARLRLPLGTVKGRINRGLTRMRNEVTAWTRPGEPDIRDAGPAADALPTAA